MRLALLSNHEIEIRIKNKVSLERQTTVDIISLLEEIAARQIYLARGYGSLIEYCIKALGYSESAAHRRVSAMRIAKEIPNIKHGLATGKLNLINVAKANTVFKQREKCNAPLSLEEKKTVINSMENKSTREVEKSLFEIMPAEIPVERVRAVAADKTQISIIIDEELKIKLDRIKMLWSHKNPNPSYSELLEMLADFTLKKESKAETQSDTSAGGKAPSTKLPQTNQRQYLSINIRRQIWQKARGQCQFVDEISKRQCQSKFQLEIEHKRPVAKGGTNAEENLELLCRAHNQFRARQHFGTFGDYEKFLN